MMSQQRVDPDLEAALERLRDKVGANGESGEAARARQAEQAATRQRYNGDGFYTRHTTADVKLAAEQASQRYK